MNSNHKNTIRQIQKTKKQLSSTQCDLSLNAILGGEICQRIFSECREFRSRIYTPLKTTFLFIKQVLDPDKSCKKAVAGFAVERLLMSKDKISTNTGPYCNARKRLPEKAVRDLVKEVGGAALNKAPKGWMPYGRELKSFDGSCTKMPDTVSNQKAFPQHKNQKKGAGFPITRFVVVMSLTLGTVLDYAMDAFKGKGTGESSLLRKIWGCIKKNDIVLGDRYFPNFFLISDLQKISADGIFKGQSQRHYDFRLGQRLGKNDHVARWKKPQKPDWMSAKEYAGYADEISIREFKVAGNVYVTTFLDAKKYHKKELAEIYERRWEIEVHLKHIKDTMNMDMLSCTTPKMVRKEIGMHFLAYNFIRLIMVEACLKHGAVPWKVSFKGAIQLITGAMPHFLNSDQKSNKKLYAMLLEWIVKNKVGNRPGRVEPRLVKQRPKAFQTLKRPRTIERERLLKRRRKMILRNAEA